MMRIRMITLRLPPDVERRIEDIVSRAGHTKTFYITEAVLEYLDVNRPNGSGRCWTH